MYEIKDLEKYYVKHLNYNSYGNKNPERYLYNLFEFKFHINLNSSFVLSNEFLYSIVSFLLKFSIGSKKELNLSDSVVAKALEKVLENPLPVSEGGYGKPLGNKRGNNLSGFLKIKLKSLGIRVVYKLIKIDGQMLVVVIGARADDEVYDTAKKRADKHEI